MKPAQKYVGSSLEDELLQLIARQVNRVPIPIIVSAAILAGFASQYLSPAIWGSWLGVYLVLVLIRWLVYRRLPWLTNIPIRRRIRIVIALNAVNGVATALSLVFFPYFSELERAVQTILLMALCVASVFTTAGYRPIFYVVFAPIIASTSLMWAFSPGHSENHVPEYLMTLLIVMFGGLLMGMAKDAFRLFRESFEIRLQQLELNAKLQDALEKAQSASRAKTRFLASASHDLRQPIHTLSLFATALNLQPLDARSREITQNMNTALGVLASQLDALLDISKLDANVVRVDKSPVKMRPLLQRLSLEMKNLAEEKSLSYSLDCPQDFHVETDEVLLERILRNIVSNAVKYTENGSVRVSASDLDGELVIKIEDTGCGIASEEQEHIFEEFYQVSNPERDRSKGLGLGLAIVRRLTELLEIEWTIDSVPDAGTAFTFKLPLIPEVAIEKAADPGADIAWTDLSVLVVDDEEAVRMGMKTLLESLGCQVTVTDSTESSMQAVATHRPDLVLADFRLRGTETGIQVIGELRNRMPGLPAILISGDTAPDRLRDAREAGLELLHKPVMMEALKRAVIEACRK